MCHREKMIMRKSVGPVCGRWVSVFVLLSSVAATVFSSFQISSAHAAQDSNPTDSAVRWSEQRPYSVSAVDYRDRDQLRSDGANQPSRPGQPDGLSQEYGTPGLTPDSEGLAFEWNGLSRSDRAPGNSLDQLEFQPPDGGTPHRQAEPDNFGQYMRAQSSGVPGSLDRGEAVGSMEKGRDPAARARDAFASSRPGPDPSTRAVGKQFAAAAESAATDLPEKEHGVNPGFSQDHGRSSKHTKTQDRLPNPDASSYQGYLNRMQAYQRSNMMLKMQIENERLLQDYKRARQAAQAVDSRIAGLSPGSASSGGGFSSVPYVISIVGVENERKANVVVPGLGDFVVRPGQRLVNGWRVVSVTSSSVFVDSGSGRIFSLPLRRLARTQDR